MKIKIKFASWTGKAELEIEAKSKKEAVEKAVEDGANLDGANLDGANLYGANLYGAKLWRKRPVLQLGQCGSRNGITLAYFFEDKSEPKVKCGCFYGTLTEFRAKIHETHAGTFFEREYNILADHIEEIYNLQKEEHGEPCTVESNCSASSQKGNTND